MKRPNAGCIRIGGGNIYVGNRTPRHAVEIVTNDIRPHSWGWAEGKNLPPILDSLDRYRDLTANIYGNFRFMGDANDCPMMVRNRLKTRHFSMTQTCESLGNKVGHARTFSMVAFEIPQWNNFIVSHIAIHPNWVERIEAGPVLREFKKSMIVLEYLIPLSKSISDATVITGDWNISREEALTRRHSTPHSILLSRGMTFVTDHLDGIGYTKNLVLNDLKTLPPKVTGSDTHNWMIADFKRR